MDPEKPEKIILKIKLSKPPDNQQNEAEQNEQASAECKQEDLVEREQQDPDFAVDDDELEEVEIRDLEGEEEEEAGKDKRRICIHCGKSFMHGKALGGHLRIHGENSGRSNPKTKGSGSGSGVGPGAGEDPCSCQVCGRNFRSKMSLYGHMKVHINRGQRRDSDENSADLSPSQLELAAVDGLKELMGWPMKGCRGGRVPYSSAEPSATPLALVRYSHLVEVADGGGEGQIDGEVRSAGLTPREKYDVNKKGKGIGEYDDDELYFLQDYLGIPYDSASDPGTTNNNNAVYSYFRFVWGDTSTNTNTSLNCSTKKRKIIRDLENEMKYICTICGKSFRTQQGLGGHRSATHHREKAIQLIEKPNPNSAPTHAQMENGSGSTHSGIDKNGANGIKDGVEMVGELVHKCNICNQSLSSDLAALEEHQKCHSIVSFKDTSTGQIGSETGRPEIDLNVTLQEEEDTGAN